MNTDNNTNAGEPLNAGKLTREELVAATVLGFDHGLSRIGVALKPAGQDWALPIRVLEVGNEVEAIRAVRRVIEEYKPAAVVMGLPRHADPEQMKIVRRFARKAREGTRGVRWLFADETMTTQHAEQLAFEAAGAGGGLKPADDLAAKLIVDQYIAASR